MTRVVRHPYMIGFREQSAFKETYGGEAALSCRS